MTLHDEILTAIESTVEAHFKGNPLVNPEQIEAEKRAQQYTFEIGTLVVKQNPYAAAVDLEYPTLYPEGTGETRRIRKAGVLREYHAENPLPLEASIPGGTAFPFLYEDKESLYDDGLDGDVLPEEPGLPTRDSYTRVGKYLHNVIKMVRLRYAMKNRTGPNGKPSKGWVLVLYSGGDT
jgi:hypothetical protein